MRSAPGHLMLGILVAVGSGTLVAAVHASGPTLGDVLASSGITESGHLSATYADGFNRGQVLAYRAFDTDSNSFEFNQAMLTLARQPADGVSGLVTLLAGSDAKIVNAGYGNGSNADFALEQAYLQYAHSGFTLIGGRFVTLSGAEVIDASADTNISRSLLFQIATPLVHTGVRASYALDMATVYLGVNNGIYTGNAVDTNKQKTLETGVALAPNAKLNLTFYDYYSHENYAGLNYADFVGSYQVTENLQFVLNGDWFSQHSTATPPGPADAWGFAGYLNYAFDVQWKGSLRGEYVKTRNVAMNLPPDGKATLSEVTATVGYSPVKNFTVLGELRYDMGDKVYPNPGIDPARTFSGTQGNAALEAIYAF